VAWSLLPLAAYLTHALALLGRLVSAIVQFAGSFVFSPRAWLGVILVGISALLFLVSGGIPVVRWNRKRKKARESQARQRADGESYPPASVPTARQQQQQPSAPPPPSGEDDSMREIQDILRKRGIN
jgi:hypothetical protein